MDRDALLRWALIILPSAGLVGLVYVLLSATGERSEDPLGSFAVGDVSHFKSVANPPSQSLNTLTLNDGSTITLADKRGQVILVNYWATWCGPCILEMPSLNDLQTRYGSDDFEVVTISMDNTIEQAATFFEDNDLDALTLYHGFDLGSVQRLGVRGLPVSILYDRNSYEIGRVEREADWSSPDAQALISAAIERY